MPKESVCDKAIYNQACSLQESTASFIEDAISNMNILSSVINLDNLDDEEKAAFAEWHKGMQQAAKVIRRPA